MDRCTYTHSATQDCVVCQDQPFIPYVPAHATITPLIGWNAGANSVEAKRYSGGVIGTWNAPVGTAGTVVGLAAVPRLDVTDVQSITHGIYAFTVGGATLAQAVMAGVPKGSARQITSGDDILSVRRYGGIVTMMLNDYELFSVADSFNGFTMLACTMFASGDIIK